MKIKICFVNGDVMTLHNCTQERWDLFKDMLNDPEKDRWISVDSGNSMVQKKHISVVRFMEEQE